MKQSNVSKFLFYISSAILVFCLIFGYGLYSGYRQTVIFKAVQKIYKSIKSVKNEFSTITKQHPTHFLQALRHTGEGVTVNDAAANQSDLIFLSGFFKDTNEIRLIKRDGTVVARWPVVFSEIISDTSHLETPPETDWNVDTHGALANSDGSVVFNFEYAGLIKLDRCNHVMWTLPRITHHSIEKSEKGGYWVPGQRYHPKESSSVYPPFQTPFYEDVIWKISEDGKVVDEIPIVELFYKNGLEALLTATGESFSNDLVWDQEIVHLNKVAELPMGLVNDFPMFEAGYLAVSFREHNLVMVLNPDTEKIKWWHVGPWVRQHDPEFKPGGTIVVFNNNIYGKRTDAKIVEDIESMPLSNIIEIDPKTNAHKIIYGGTEEQKMRTSVRGKVKLTSQGGLLITEFEAGRVFETDPQGRIIWEYINRYDVDEVAEITEARVYPEVYFNVKSWSCEK